MSAVVIVGAGIAGLTTALCPHEQGVDVEVYERVTQLRRRAANLKAGGMSPEAFDWLFAYDAAEVVAGALRGADV